LTQDFEVTAEELVRTLQRRGIPLPSEIGAFIVLEVCEKLIGRPAEVSTRDVIITEQGDVELGESTRPEPESLAVSALLGVLAELLVCAAPGVPNMLLDLVEHGPNEERLTLALLRSDLEACLLPLNRGAQRRVLSRLVREVRKSVASAQPPAAPIDVGDVDADFDSLIGGASPATQRAAEERTTGHGRILQPRSGLPLGVGSDRPGLGAPPPQNVGEAVTASRRLRPPVEERTAMHGARRAQRERADDTRSSRAPAADGGDEPSRRLADESGRGRAAPGLGSEDDARSRGRGDEPSRRFAAEDAADGDGRSLRARSRARGDEPSQRFAEEGARGRGRAASGSGSEDEGRGRGRRDERDDSPSRSRSARGRGEDADAAPSRSRSAGRSRGDDADDARSRSAGRSRGIGEPYAADSGKRSSAALDVDSLVEIQAKRGRVGMWVFLLSTAAAVGLLLGYFALGREQSQSALGFLKPAERSDAAASKPPPPRRSYGDLRVNSQPDRAQVLLLIGPGPALATDIPLGVAQEFLATAPDHRPGRALLPADAVWDEVAGQPRYELAIQARPITDPKRSRGADAIGSTLLPQNVGAPSGKLGSVRLVTTPRAAQVYQLIGFTPDVHVDNLPLDRAYELLVYVEGRPSVRQRVEAKDFVEQAGKRVANIDVKLPAAD
jgi:hypothetical protein